MVKLTTMSNFLENAILDLVLRGVAYPGGNTIYAALFTSPTTDAGGGSEVSTIGTGYVRTQISTFDPPVAGQTSNSTTVSFPTAAVNWGLITHFALFDSSAGGNMLYHGPLTVPKLTNAGDTVILPPGNITVLHD